MTGTRDIIVIGASAGGLDALCRLIGGLPSTFQASVLIVRHTHPDGPGMLANVLGRCTGLPVSYGSQATEIMRADVYLASPGHHLTVLRPGYLGLDQGPKEISLGPRLTHFFDRQPISTGHG